MAVKNIEKSITSLSIGLAYLENIVKERLKAYFNNTILILPSPPKFDSGDPLSIFIKKHSFNESEIIVLLTALAPHIQSDFFDTIIQDFFKQATDFHPIGGTRGKQFRGFLPTGETAIFLLAGDNLEKKFSFQSIFKENHIFFKKQIVYLELPHEGEPILSGRLIMPYELVELLTSGQVSKPRFGLNFPADRVETKMEWEDLILPNTTLLQIKELTTWLEHGETLLHDWGMSKHIKPGYRALFYGPSGTGKTLTAALLGKQMQRDVYKIDLSMVISKFIGETEKNLANLFDKAENKDWILFFDEADALFGKRTNVRDAHDRYANQEVSYLLQRIETFNGLVILASNFKSNIDEAFVRRFQSIIHFPMPQVHERLRLWQNTFPKNINIAKDINLPSVSDRFELSGASIVNIVQFCCLRALENKRKEITLEDLNDGITKEFSKEGKII